MGAWEQLVAGALGGLPITRIICTHRHADHAGLAGWLTERFDCELWMPHIEYHSAQAARLQGTDAPDLEVEFYRQAGWDELALTSFKQNYGSISSMIYPLPERFRRIGDGDVLRIGDDDWEVIVGQGHTAEHACLYCEARELFISGDQVLPLISSNVSLHPSFPDCNPLGEWFSSMARLREKVRDSALVLPSHNECFLGLHARIDYLMSTQNRVLTRLQRELSEYRRSVDIFPCLFGREIGMGDGIVLSLATGESLANLQYLLAEGLVERVADVTNVYWFKAKPKQLCCSS